jgi:hypothetical protein
VLRLLAILRRSILFEFGVDWDVHLLDAAHVGDRIFGKATGYEGAGCVFTREDVVGAAWAVGLRGDGDVVNRAVYGEVDGLSGVGAVVGEELGVG